MNVTKIILTRCQIFHLKCTKFNFGWGFTPDPTAGAHSASPDPLAGFGEREGKGREKRERRRRKEEGREKGERWEREGVGVRGSVSRTYWG